MEVASLKSGRIVMVLEVASLMDGQSCYRGGRFECRENGYVTEVVTNGGRMITLQRLTV